MSLVSRCGIRYLVDHWAGRHGLARAFWLNFAAIFVLTTLIEGYLRPGTLGELLGGSMMPADTFGLIALAYFAFTRLVVLPWQVIGLVRTCDSYYLRASTRNRVWAVYLALVLAGVVVCISVFGTFHAWLAARSMENAEVGGDVPTFAIEATSDGTEALLSGSIDPGVTRALAAFLQANPRTEVLVLHSDGGNIYEARGLVRLVLEQALDTHVEVACRSACTTVYLAGAHRSIGANAALGFHAYRLDARNINPYIDAQREQATDWAFYRTRGVTERFVQRAFATSPTSMWNPSHEQLIDAGVVHERIEAPRGSK